MDVDALLVALNAEIAGWHESDAGPALPVTVVVGAPRSGTTLTYQLLAASGAFAYPSNLVARFWQAPAFGARLATVLGPLLPPPVPAYRSNAGNTEGWSGPHELSWFWREQLAFGAHHGHFAVQPGLAARLGAFEREAGRPLLLKSNLLCFAVPALAAALPTARFVWVRRDPVDTALSILAMRERVHGDAGRWWSIEPPGVDLAASPADQVAFQVARCTAALAAAAAALPDRVVTLDYAALCADVHGTLAPLVPDPSALPASFPSSTRDDPRADAVRAALARA
ncbi:MAG: sulfotransferase [Alphaproteobacteria bacterium]|nr:sulfotransferase [Alphaproteobacteria bacterium]